MPANHFRKSGMATGVVDRVRSGFADAMRYDKHRPSYPIESIQTILEEGAVEHVHGAHTLDIASGTGMLTAQLAALPATYEIIATEPHDDMRQVLHKRVLERVGNVDARRLVWAMSRLHGPTLFS